VHTEFRRLRSSRGIRPYSLKPSSILCKCSYLKQDSILGIVQQWIAQKEDIFHAKHMLLEFHNQNRGDRNSLCLGITTITVQNITLKNIQISFISHYIQVCFSNKLNINRLSKVFNLRRMVSILITLQCLMYTHHTVQSVKF